MAGGRFAVEAIFKARDMLSPKLAAMGTNVNRFQRRARRSFARVRLGFKKFAGGMKTGALVIIGALVAVGASLARVLGAGVDFEQAITNVGAVSKKSRAEIQELEAKALELGASTKFTSTQVAQGMEVLAKAGLAPNEILETIGGTLLAAAASGDELASTTSAVISVMKGMNLPTTQVDEYGNTINNAVRISDVLALASTKTQSTIASLADSMSKVALTAATLNIPLEEVVASVALLQDVGLDASSSGTAMNVMLNRLAAATPKVRKQMKAAGIVFEDLEGNMLPLPKVLQSMADAAGGGNARAVKLFAELVGIRGQRAANALSRLKKEGKLDTLVAQLKDAEGTSQAIAGIRMNTFKGDMLLLSSAVDNVKTEIFDLESGPLRAIVKTMTAWVGENKELIKSNALDFLEDMRKALPSIVTNLKTMGTIVGTLARAFFIFARFIEPVVNLLALIIDAVKFLVEGAGKMGLAFVNSVLWRFGVAPLTVGADGSGAAAPAPTAAPNMSLGNGTLAIVTDDNVQVEVVESLPGINFSLSQSGNF